MEWSVMKAFKLLEFDKRPMKLKGGKIIAATVIPLTDDSLDGGNYTAMPSGKRIVLKSGGMLALGSPDAKLAFSLMKPRGASLGEGLLEIESPFEEVYVEEANRTSVKHYSIDFDSVFPALHGYWIPGNITAPDKSMYEGWFKINDFSVELLVIGCEQDLSLGAKVVAKNDEGVVISL
jgi:hypothetical protein